VESAILAPGVYWTVRTLVVSWVVAWAIIWNNQLFWLQVLLWWHSACIAGNKFGKLLSPVFGDLAWFHICNTHNLLILEILCHQQKYRGNWFDQSVIPCPFPVTYLSCECLSHFQGILPNLMQGMNALVMQFKV